jgi:pectate lyase
MVWTCPKNITYHKAQTTAGVDTTRREEDSNTEIWVDQVNLSYNDRARNGRTEKNGDWESEAVNYANKLWKVSAYCYSYLRAAKKIYDLCFVAVFVTENVKWK